jgi:hypothetical protein
LGAGVAGLSFASSLTGCATTPSAADSQNTAKAVRPFYVIGHDPNTKDAAARYLSRGANALEPDINVFSSRRSELCVDHGPDLSAGPGSDRAPSLVEYLTDLRALARQYPALSLIYFDCKTLAATAEHGVTLLEAARTHLVGEGPDRLDINIVISVASLKDQAIFRDIATKLRPGEALMIDQENDPVAIADAFVQMGAKGPQCFSNGISVENEASCLLAPHIRPSIERACAMRDQDRQFRFVAVWTVNDPAHMSDYIGLGVDGMIVDAETPWYNPGAGLGALTHLIGEEGPKLGIRNATRDDRPFG